MKKLLFITVLCFLHLLLLAQRAGDIIFYEDFEGGLPEGWEEVDLTDENMHWQWTNEDVIGCYTWVTPEDIESETPENGYMVMNPDGWNTVPLFTHMSQGGVLPPMLIEVDNYIISPPVNLSDCEYAILEFYQDVRKYGDMKSSVFISSDYSPENSKMSHWTEYFTSEDLAWNESKKGIFQINISDVAAGSDSVYFRFHLYDGAMYYWIIDDIKIYEPYENNLEITNSWIFYDWYQTPPTGSFGIEGFLQHGGYFTKIPLDQKLPFAGSMAAIINLGYSDQSNVRLETTFYHKSSYDSEDSVLVHQTVSESINLQKFESDTLFISLDYEPDVWGVYSIVNQIVMDNADDLPVNNITHHSIEITNSVYSRTSDVINDYVNTNLFTTPNEPFGIGNYYKLSQPVTEVEYINWHFSDKNNDYLEEIGNGEYVATGKIFAYNEELEDWEDEPIIETEPYTLAISDTNSMVRMEFVKNGTSEYLLPGDYIVFLDLSDHYLEFNHPFYIGEDNSIEQPMGSSFWHAGSWFPASHNPAIDLIIAAEGWILTDKISNSNWYCSQNFPNPAKVKTVIEYQLENSSDIILEVMDITGKLILQMNEGQKPAGKHQLELDVSGLDAGIYFYRISAGNLVQSRKMIVTN